jgi:hypothetical protein
MSLDHIPKSQALVAATSLGPRATCTQNTIVQLIDIRTIFDASKSQAPREEAI